MLASSACYAWTAGCSNPIALTGGRNCGITALGASEHCGIMTVVVVLIERARSARRANILVAIVARTLLVRFTWYVSD